MCKRKVAAMTRRDGSEVEISCGSYFAGEKLLCLSCDNKAKRDYPQGWVGYPGDTCRHGTYVGGCGVDHICGACEAGD